MSDTAVTPQPTRTDTRAPMCSGRWEIEATPAIGPSILFGTLSLSPTDAWAVGGAGPVALVEHWEGSNWSVVPTPDLHSSFSQLISVAAHSESDVWAVGDYYPDETAVRTGLIEHWDGTAWTVVPGPTTESDLIDVTALPTGDAWAAGWMLDDQGKPATLVEHWDGSTWTVVSTPPLGDHFSQLWAIVAISSSDIWVAGNFDIGSVTIPLMEHWDGTAWTVVDTHAPELTYLRDLGATSSFDVWAVGSRSDGSRRSETVALHWDGVAWLRQSTPALKTRSASLSGVAAISSSDAWAVGSFRRKNRANTLIVHWDGADWLVVDSPNADASFLSAVSASSRSDVIAVGGNGYTLVERYCLDAQPSSVVSAT